ncbi:MAG: YceD family protein [Reinekea sp.]|jgi:uncharacterized protein
MSNFELPEQVNPYQLADKSADLSGVISASRLKRLEQASDELVSDAEAQLSFYWDDSGRRVISGEVTGTAQLLCQRCLQPFERKLEGSFQLALVYNDEMAKALPTHLDSLLLLPDEPLDLALIVEDELLLSLPMYANHPEGECQIETRFGADEPEGQPEKAPNPFDVLKDLK